MIARTLLIAAAALVPSIASAQDAACDRVAATLKLPDAKVTSARLVPTGSFAPPGRGAETSRPIAGLPAFCRVELTITPSSDSDIRSEVATHSTNDQVDRTRPLCASPQIAHYKGTGSIDQADNFFCAEKSTNVPASK
jgi:hypothetical protein